MIKLTLPIYYKDKQGMHLLGLNKYERMHYHKLNKIKHDFYDRVKNEIGDVDMLKGKYTANFKLWYKSPVCDAPNIIAVMEKLTMDGLQVHNIIEEDNVKFYQGASWTVEGQDREYPRVEIEIREKM